MHKVVTHLCFGFADRPDESNAEPGHTREFVYTLWGFIPHQLADRRKTNLDLFYRYREFAMGTGRIETLYPSGQNGRVKIITVLIST